MARWWRGMALVHGCLEGNGHCASLRLAQHHHNRTVQPPVLSLKRKLDGLQEALGYRFAQVPLLDLALTHRSAAAQHNERLEFLGDALLNFVVAAALYDRFPAAREGDLSRLRANLVRGETLAQLAGSLGLGAYLILGSGELKSGGHRRESTLADALEAIIGAVYLDGGIDRCTAVVLRLFEGRLDSLSPVAQLKDPKTRLQEFLQARGLPPPTYRVVSTEGTAHDQTFRVACVLPDLSPDTEGVGSSRRRAEQEAARRALERLDHD